MFGLNIFKKGSTSRSFDNQAVDLDIKKIRKDFPILNQKIYDRDLIYFDNGATTQKPQSVIDAINRVYADYNSNVHRGIHFLSGQMTEMYEEARTKVQKFLNAKFPHEIIFTAGVTDSLNLVAYSFGEAYIKADDEIIVSEMEHHSNIVPWQIICQQKGATLKVIPFNDSGELLLEEYKKLITPKTKLVAVTHVSNSLGTVNPVKEIIDIAHAHQVPVLIDGAQAIQHEEIDVQALDCDFYAFSGHKVYGPTGIGILYGKERWLNEMPPYRSGGDMIDRVSFERTTYNDLPFKFEAGTPNYIGSIGLGYALDYLSNLGMKNIRQREKKMLDYAGEKLSAIPGLRVYGTAENKACLFSFLLDGIHPYDAGVLLDRMGIAVRTGHHCTHPLWAHFQTDGSIRASLVFYNTLEEIDALVTAILKIKEMAEVQTTLPVFNRTEAAQKTIEQAQQEIIAEFKGVDDWLDKYNLLIQMGKTLPALSEEKKTEDNLIKGCQMRTWHRSSLVGGRVHFEIDSMSLVIRGAIVLLLRVLEGRTPAEIKDANLYFIDETGLRPLFAPTNANSLWKMVTQMQTDAANYKEKAGL